MICDSGLDTLAAVEDYNPPHSAVVVPGETVGERLLNVAAECVSLSLLTGALGERLAHWMRSTEKEKPLPPEEWNDGFELYSKAVLGLAKEERVRRELVRRLEGAGVVHLTEKQYREELDQLAEETVKRLPEHRLQELLDERQRR